METNNRNAAIDLLRIFAMYFIILGHFLIYRQNGLILASDGGCIINTSSDYLPVVLMSFAIIGTNLFFLISGYFGIHYRITKLIEIMLTTILWGG